MTGFVDLSREIEGLRGSRVHVLPAADEERVRERLLRHGFDLRVVEGKRARGESAFFEEVARALELPAWFGSNWDAFNDSLSDVVEGETRPLAILWRDAHLSLGADVQTVLNAVLAFEAAWAYPQPDDEEPVQAVVFLFGEGDGFAR